MYSIVGYMVMFLVVVIPIVLIVSLIAIFVKKSKDGEKSEDNFEKNIRTIYLYLVSIVLLFVAVFSIIGIFNSTTNYFLPEKQVVDKRVYNMEITQEDYNRNIYLRDLMTAIGAFAISAPLFVYHTKLARGNK
ncbi:MAG: hypothetical protein N2749_06935 [Clostridia bacterium]|nr:hypothetical protein [Clostridia bacterium]